MPGSSIFTPVPISLLDEISNLPDGPNTWVVVETSTGTRKLLGENLRTDLLVGLGTAASKDVGTNIGNVIVLNADGLIPEELYKSPAYRSIETGALTSITNKHRRMVSVSFQSSATADRSHVSASTGSIASGIYSSVFSSTTGSASGIASNVTASGGSTATGLYSQVNASSNSNASANVSQVNASTESNATNFRSQVNASNTGVASGIQSQVNASNVSTASGQFSQVNAASESGATNLYTQVNASLSSFADNEYSQVNASEFSRAKGRRSQVNASEKSEARRSLSQVNASNECFAGIFGSGQPGTWTQINASEKCEAKANLSQINCSNSSATEGNWAQVSASQNSIAKGNNTAITASLSCEIYSAGSGCEINASQLCEIFEDPENFILFSQINASESSMVSASISQINNSSHCAVALPNSQINSSRATATKSSFTSVWGHDAGTTPSTANVTVEINSLSGSVDAQTYLTAGVDYAELFKNGTSEKQGYGLLQALDGDLVLPAEEGDDIIGITSARPGVVGGEASFCWSERYLKNEWGEFLYHDVEITQSDGSKKSVSAKIENPEYDPNRKYTSRSERSDEWTVVGLMGQLPLRVDDTVSVGNYIKPLSKGVGTKSDSRTSIRVMKVTRPFDEDKGYAVAMVLIK